MSTVKRNKDEWVALARLLVKLQLLDEASYTQNFEPLSNQVPTSEPIACGAALHLFDEPDAITLVAQQLGIREFNLAQQEWTVSIQRMLKELSGKVSVEMWAECRAVPVHRERGMLIIAHANPLARDVKQTLDFALGESTRIGIAPESQITAVLSGAPAQESRSAQASLDGIEFNQTKLAASESSGHQESTISATDVDAAPIVRIVNKIFLDAFERGASDIHISPEKLQLTVKVRADGIMTELLTVPSSTAMAIVSRIKLLAGMDISEKRRPQDGRIRINLKDSYKDLRVSTVPTLYGENVVARVLNSDLTSVTFASLGMPKEILSNLSKDLSGTSQVVLVTGPTGSGKTSTLYAAVTELRDGHRNLITIEDPIEYRMTGVTQIQVNTKIGMTFAEAIRSVLRQDPDVVVVGEVRDAETATTAMQAAQTGHIVLATLHANSAPAAITRLRDLEIPPYLISSSVRGVLAQRLVRRLCGNCAQADTRDTTFRLIGKYGRDALPRCSKGCPQCGDTGFQGRTGVYSYLSFTDEVKIAIRDQKGEQEIEQIARDYGYRSLEESALNLVAEGVTSIDEVVRVIGQIGAATQIGSSPPPVVPARQPSPHWPTKPLEIHQTESKSTGTEKARKKKVLLVEDDENLRQIITMTLERAMFDVVQAKHGKEALSTIAKDMPDIVVCDLMMPVMDGAETVQRLRGSPNTKKLPILMLTSADSDEHEIRLLKSGADDFVSKAAGRKVFISRINRLLERAYGEA